MHYFGNVPPPFLFNTIKHHSYFQLNFIKEAKEQELNIEEISDRLVSIGNSMIDLYYGRMSPKDVVHEVENKLKVSNFFLEDYYRSFINSSKKKYQTITLPDQSNWTLLVGRESERYIHIHPSRDSLHTMRIGAVALKTAILLLIHFEDELVHGDLVQLVNKTRSLYMKEPPVKNEHYTKGLRRVLKLFT